MIVRHLDATHLGRTVTLPTLSAPGRCRRGILRTITLNASNDTSTLTLGDHQHSVPNGATIYVTTELSGL